MSRVISFRASEELDEFLEQEAERRMTTKSTVAQMLVAERVREMREEGTGEEIEDQSSEAEESSRSGSESKEMGVEDLPPIFAERSDKWYKPNSDKHEFAVECNNGEKKYYKTAENAAKRLRGDYDS